MAPIIQRGRNLSNVESFAMTGYSGGAVDGRSLEGIETPWGIEGVNIHISICINIRMVSILINVNI